MDNSTWLKNTANKFSGLWALWTYVVTEKEVHLIIF